MATNRIAGMLATIPAPAFVSVAPHVVHTVFVDADPGDVAELHDAEAEVLAGPWRLTIRRNLDDFGPGALRAEARTAVTYHGNQRRSGAVEGEGGGWAFYTASGDELAALADGMREVAEILRTASLFAGAPDRYDGGDANA